MKAEWAKAGRRALARGLAIAGCVVAAAGPARSADGDVPHFDVRPSCRAAAVSDPGLRRALSAASAENSCVESEHNSRDTLQKDWRTFSAVARRDCTRLSTLGGLPSYTELLTCLEMWRDARQLPREQNSEVPEPSRVATPASE